MLDIRQQLLLLLLLFLLLSVYYAWDVDACGKQSKPN